MRRSSPTTFEEFYREFSREMRIRILELLREVDAQHGGPGKSLGQSLFECVNQSLRREKGIDLPSFRPYSEDVGIFQRRACGDLPGICDNPDPDLIRMFLAETWAVLARAGSGEASVAASEFEVKLNAILASANYESRLRRGEWALSFETQAEALRHVLLEGQDEMAGCKQVDVQVETVVTTIQDRLSIPGTIVLDYGVGLGRVLAGLSTAPLFAQSKYVAVDEPVPDTVRELARQYNIDATFLSRTDFLTRSDIKSDVILLVNTLHHIPFRELAKQLDHLLRSLNKDGYLLVHEMGELRKPEQYNVPWRIEDVICLFRGPGLETNPRSSLTYSRIPLSNTIVKIKRSKSFSAILTRNAKWVWREMKQRVVQELENLFKEKQPERQMELQYALMINANLDLNMP